MSDPDDETTHEQVIAAAQAYIANTKGWESEEYRLEDYSLSEDGSEAVITATFLADEEDSIPGGGSSVELHVDPSSNDVVEELGFQ
jgi:hypothetical protein